MALGEFPQGQFLTLSEMEDGKKWVAEIVGPDPTFGMKRIFQPEVEANVYELFDGIYQIHGIYPGITPFEKEYTQVKDGHMTRRLDYRWVRSIAPQLAMEAPARADRVRWQIKRILAEIQDHLDHELVRESLLSQQDQLQDVEEQETLTHILSQLIRDKAKIIKHFEQQIKLYDQMYQ